MSYLEDFETTLKDVVNAKRLSASKMAKLTEIAMKSVEHDTKLVAILYRTHKSLSSAAKVSSLYAFDALARAARSYATKRGIVGDINSSTGNAATFLLKVEGVLDGLFQDMIALDNAEAKEKTKKVLDIWTKSNTFPSPVLTRLREMMDSRKESVKNPTPPITRVETQALPRITTPSSTTPSQGPTPPLPESVQSTLLALLGQAAQAAGQPRIQTPPNTVSAPPLSGHLALLQQLALTANAPNGPPSQPAIQVPLQHTRPLSVPQHPHPSQLNSQPQPYSSSHTQHDPRRDSWQGRSNQFDQGRERDSFHDSNPRGGFQRGFRGRGRGRGRWDDRDHDRFKDRDWNSSPRPRTSRSRSPRRFNGHRPRPYSPPQRPAASRDVAQDQTSAKLPEPGKDEFGRDIRPSSATPPRAASVDAQTQPPVVPSVDLARTAAPENRVPVSDQLPSVAASTSTQKVEPRKPSSAPALQQPGLDQFDITTFDFTAPTSWEALGKMWHSTYGDTPTQEELMQFIMTGGVVAFTGQANAVQTGQWQDPSWGAQSAGHGHGWQGGRGRGRGLMDGRTSDTHGHGNHRDGGHWDEDTQHSDAIVLGEAGGQNGGHGEDQAYTDLAQMGRDDLPNVNPDDPQNVGSGRMQRVGDKWVLTQESGHEA
ncbi:hypothetical protein DEU56DRAFT_818918 [Suillus clintonianus]|uniref:uncharacterized protein n=1 Tax=Suillus clintonianus TaxID=1904413 RepID=UPI001B881321|nr:uncharacterized protein DEU56DRAFT_818918 [Suillus clintonianus]KAG2128551.1 hypothetical protein DEU56DRAFT_818918 [Suillus clintonianus]